MASSVLIGGLEADRRLSAAPEESVVGKAVRAWRGASCIDAKTLHHPVWPAQKQLAKLYKDISRSPTAKAIVDTALRDGTKYCFYDPTVKVPSRCGKKALGIFDIRENEVDIDPEKDRSEEFMATIFLHETRHKIQTINGQDTRAIINVFPWSRISYDMFMEADARVMTIVVAHELEQAGLPGYMQDLRSDLGHADMVGSFEDVLASGGGMKKAIGNSVLIFVRKSILLPAYTNKMQDWIERTGFHPGPDEKGVDLMTAEFLAPLGWAGAYGNYMDADLVAALRESFTEEDHKALLTARARVGGVWGEACGRPAPASS
ncbi:MAG: hypothetical protein HY370_09295 [Proteobacteria bacterium]|nr:hypothetical protein [Pseudomonadota bacterium]